MSTNFLEKILVKNGENSGAKSIKYFLEKNVVKNGENYCVFFQVQNRAWTGRWNLPDCIYAFNLRNTDNYGTVVRNGHWFILE